MSDERDLEQLFRAAREQPMQPSDALMQRLLADAREAQPRAAAPPRPARVRAPRHLLSRWTAALGGRGALAGLTTAAVAGLFIGYAAPGTLDWLASPVLQDSASVELMVADTLFLGEG